MYCSYLTKLFLSFCQSNTLDNIAYIMPGLWVKDDNQCGVILASEVNMFDWSGPSREWSLDFNLSHCLASENLDISSVKMFLKYFFKNPVLLIF